MTTNKCLAAATLEGAVWKKSSYSGGSEGQCVEVADLDTAIAVRDSKKKEGPALAVPRATFASFIDTVKSGAMDFGMFG
ncbi:DUF397 domain-containing protein [Streptomyces sp. DSM 41527]|uniref:DUF397 domain-containing protein n=1 Tax=Streptomyces mooreae TaxID=3075523 RepID=A0ABU2TE21_9ACTN|nr:DUF397 domain-containing protein [Streptomyces sp. DSM 41527]MDT0459165.1 DUF397 domain-containing protein [Streptomyces sp. DSM 41527]